MRIDLKKLVLSNFMGTREFTLEPNGKNCVVRGQNGAGKSTLSHAAHWLLFNKNADGHADFALKTLDKDGQELHNLNHSVEAVLEIDGKPLTLKKVFKERYTKKRGNPRAEFTGHTTDFFIEGVPVQEKDWKAHIASIINEDTFKLLTSPSHFNSLHWGRRREILLQVCGNVADADVIASDRDLASLPDILGTHSLDEQRKIITAKKREINDQLKEIPARIDELTKSIVDVSAYDSAAITARVKELTDQIQTMKAGSKEAVVRKRVAEIEAHRAEVQGKLDTLKRNAEKAADNEIDLLDAAIKSAKRDLQGKATELSIVVNAIGQAEKEMARLRSEFAEVSAQEFKGSSVCPSCGQGLPEGQIQAAVAKHNEQKSRKLTDINEQGKRLKAANEDSLKDKARLEGKKDDLEELLKGLETKIQTARDLKPVTLAGVGKIEAKTIEDLTAEIAAIQEGLTASVDTTALEQEAEKERTKLAEIKNNRKAEKRIKELAEEEKKLAGEYEELERQTFLMEKFIVRKVDLLTDKINSRFRLVRWKLFEQQVNGGISECCEATVNGVPFSSANTGSQIMAGLDIITTLQEHYGVHSVLFLDHFEALSAPPPDMGCQTIFLEVSQDKELTVEYA